MSQLPPEITGLTFEQAYRQLEETVQKLEAGNLPLEESLALYRRGMALAERCSRVLDEAELSIKTLTAAGELEDFEEI
ncbi:MAG: Exodeoxyribonuclease 7 small subunit [Anaerolineae bacterium]|nr:Exodeoxyribonuclease 7 small subunit [Anaerolineae bacterium]